MLTIKINSNMPLFQVTIHASGTLGSLRKMVATRFGCSEPEEVRLFSLGKDFMLSWDNKTLEELRVGNGQSFLVSKRPHSLNLSRSQTVPVSFSPSYPYKMLFPYISIVWRVPPPPLLWYIDAVVLGSTCMRFRNKSLCRPTFYSSQSSLTECAISSCWTRNTLHRHGRWLCDFQPAPFCFILWRISKTTSNGALFWMHGLHFCCSILFRLSTP